MELINYEAISIEYMYMCVCILAIVNQHENHIFTALQYTLLCNLSPSTILCHMISQMA
jgi:hypothetical protein